MQYLGVSIFKIRGDGKDCTMKLILPTASHTYW